MMSSNPMGGLICKMCCPCKCFNCNNNSVDVLPEQNFKILLIGPSGSGKTEVAHILSKTQRSNFEATNGSKFYRAEIAMENGRKQTIGLTEIGGSVEMQRIWHHYFARTMGIAYCFDMSASYEILNATFELLAQVMAHSFVAGKSLLLIGTKSDLTDEGLQMYDFENTFQLAAMAGKYNCQLRLCCIGRGNFQGDINDGLVWLLKMIAENYDALKNRIKTDTNMQTWNDQTQKLIMAGKMKRWRYRRFPHSRAKLKSHNTFWKYGSARFASLRRPRRPNTAPAIYTIAKFSRDNSVSWQNSSDTVNTTFTVPNDNGNLASNENLHTDSQSKQITDI